MLINFEAYALWTSAFYSGYLIFEYTGNMLWSFLGNILPESWLYKMQWGIKSIKIWDGRKTTFFQSHIADLGLKIVHMAQAGPQFLDLKAYVCWWLSWLIVY